MFGEVIEMWLQEMKKYMQLHDYSYNQEARIAIFNLQGKSYHWWEQLKQVEGLEREEDSPGKYFINTSSKNIYHSSIMIRRCLSSLNSNWVT